MKIRLQNGALSFTHRASANVTCLAKKITQVFPLSTIRKKCGENEQRLTFEGQFSLFLKTPASPPSFFPTSTMDDDSDDEWYRQMEDAAPVEWDEEKPHVLTTSKHNSTKEAEQLSEDEYFGNMQRYCEKDENAGELLPEKSFIWQQMARELQAESSFSETKLSSFSPLIQVMETENPSGMVLIEQFLFSHLPLSSRIYRALRLKEPSEPLSPDGYTEINETKVISNPCIDSDDDESDIPASGSSYQQLVFVDDILHPSLAVLVSQPGCRHEAALFSSTMPIEAHLLTAVCKLLVWSNSPPRPANAEQQQQQQHFDIHLGAVDSYAVQAITDELQTLGYREKAVVPASLYVLNDPHRRALQLSPAQCITGVGVGAGAGAGSGVGYDDLSRRLLPKGYEFSRLQPDDAVLVDSCWLYRTSTSRRRIRTLIAEYPCLGIRYTNNGDDTNRDFDENNNESLLPPPPSPQQNSHPSLVCWCLTYDYGALGMLHTLPAHRGRGLARRLVSVLVDQWMRFDFGTSYNTSINPPSNIPYDMTHLII